MRSFKITALLTAAVLLCAARLGSEEAAQSEKFSLYYIPERSIVSLERFLTDNEPPLVRETRVSPANPGVDDPVVIAARISNDAKLTENRPLYAFLHYSLDDGETWTTVEMNQDEGNEDSWYAEMPPAGKPGSVAYFFTAEDDAGNHLVELPETGVEWGGVDAPRLTGRIEDENDDERIVPDDLDVLEAKVGYDGEILYFAIRVEGEISSGTVSPYNPYVYSAGIYYPESIEDGSVKTDFVLEHSQHAQFVLFPVIGLLDTEKDLVEVLTADARYYTDGERLYMRFHKRALKGEDFDRLRIIFGTAYATDYSPLTIKPVDATGFVNIVRVERRFEVR
ncbi:MAG: hypothetical protein AB1742_15885 [bacterium]